MISSLWGLLTASTPSPWWFAALYVMWILYLASTNIYRAYLAKTLSKPALVLGLPIIIVATLLDWFLNLTFCSAWFNMLPGDPSLAWQARLKMGSRELMTTRLTRYINQETDDYRKRHAEIICKLMLNSFDPRGVHCKLKMKDQENG